MPKVRVSFPVPKNHQDFEVVCCDLLRRHWLCHGLKKYLGSGYAQHGVDLYGHGPKGEGWGVQCKVREGGTLTEEEVVAEVHKAQFFEPSLDRYVIATTAQCNREVQDAVNGLCKARLQAGLFSVEVLWWDDLNDYLNQHPDSASLLQDNVPLKAESTLAGLVPAEEELVQSDGAYHAEIDKARDAVKRNQPDVALAKLAELRERHWDRLSARERYRLEANTGHSLTQKGDLAGTGQAFIRAASHQPRDNNARALRAVGLAYLGRETEAFAEADALLAEDPESAMAAVAWVSTAPTQVTMEEFISRLSPTVVAHSQVSLALARRARAAQNYGHAEQLARRAIEGEPLWSEAVEELGDLLLLQEVELLRTRLSRSPRSVNPDRIKESLALLLRAAEMPDVKASPVREAHVRAHASIARELLGDKAGSRSELERARSADPKNPLAARRYAKALQDEGQTETAVQVLRENSKDHPDPLTVVALCLLLIERGSPADLKEAADALCASLREKQSRPDVARDLAELLIRVRTCQSAFDLARQDLAEFSGDWLTSESRLFLRGRVAFAEGDIQQAKSIVKEALSAHAAPLPVDLAHRLAGLSYDLKDFVHALDLYKAITASDFIGPDTHRLLHAAEECGDDATILSRCRQLRGHGLFDQTCFELELSKLEEYNAHDEAITALRAFLLNPPDKGLVPVMRLRLSLLGLMTGAEELVERNPDRLPQVTDVTPELGHMTVVALRFGGNVQAAVRYGYQLLRQFPDRIEAYKALMAGLGPPGAEALEVQTPTIVQLGCAFLLSDAEGSEWYVIEEEEEPKPSLHEIGPDHPLALASMGKEVGEKVEWRTGISLRTGHLRSITHKYVYRWNECLRTCEGNFPKDAFVWSLPAPTTADGSPDIEAQLLTVEAEVKKKVDRVQHFLNQYKSQPLPLSFLVRHAGGSQLEAQIFIAEEEHVAVNCAPTEPAAQIEALAGLTKADVLVLDVSTLATLLMLDRVADLRRMKCRLIVSRGTLQGVRQLIQPGNPLQAKAGLLTIQDGRLVLMEGNPDRHERWIKRLKDCVELLEDRCEIVSGVVLSALDAEMRSKLVHILGRASAESIAIALDQGAVLWTDEFAVGAIASHELHASWAWTDVVYRWSAGRGFVSQQEACDVAARLNALGYSGTLVSGPVLLAAGGISKWDPDASPFKNALSVLGGQNADEQQLFLASRDVIVAVWRQSPLELTSERVVLRVLAELSKSVQGRGAIKALRHHVESIFGLDVIPSLKTKRILDSWFRAQQ